MPGLDHFGWLAPLYERVIKPRLSDPLYEVAGLPVKGMLLDTGGGTGRIAQNLVGLAGQVVVADLSLQMLKEAVKKDHLKVVNSASERMPFPDNLFERILMVDALHHVWDQVQTARELYRVLAPGGRLVIEEPDVRHWGVKLVALGEKIALMRSHFLTPPRIASLFAWPGARVEILQNGATSYIVVDRSVQG
ncbi:MAG TPA: class I SAM-dependent methyltransferase [Anaerolineales bacterium]|nr:class I SAM-dependent methyltransferase [Anaerolineales bacterium]